MSDADNPALGQAWFPSRWGAEDEIGAGNLLGPHKVLEAARLIRSGETVSLGFPYRVGMPLSPGRTFGLKMPGGPTGGPEGAISRTVWNDDFICTEIGQIGTHMDALGHLGHQVTYPCGHCDTLVYNGNKLSEIWSPYGAGQRLRNHPRPPAAVHRPAGAGSQRLAEAGRRGADPHRPRLALLL